MISQKTRSSLKITIGTILVTFGTLVIVAFASGYNLDVFRGEIYSTGLVLLGTNPSGANIEINNKKLNQKTPYRLENFKTGELSVKYSRQDYKNWFSKFIVNSGQVTFADYALLIPNNIEQFDDFSKLKFDNLLSTKERNRVFAVLNSPGSIYELDKSNEPKKTIELPPNPSIQSPNSLSETELSIDGSAIYTRANYADGSSAYFWIDSGNSNFISIEPLLSQKPKDVKFNQRNSKEIYTLDAGKIKRLNIDNKQVLELAASQVSSYQIDKDFIYTLENLSSDQGQFLIRYDYNGNNRYVLSQLPPTSSPRLINTTEYNGQKILTIHNSVNGELFVFRQDGGKNLISTLGLGTIQPTFSPNGRFLSYLQANNLKTIDLETGERFSSIVESVSKISWLTNYQLTLAKPDGIYIVDFNGYNLNKLPPNTTSADQYKFTNQLNNKIIYYTLSGQLSYYSLQPRGLINLR